MNKNSVKKHFIPLHFGLIFWISFTIPLAIASPPPTEEFPALYELFEASGADLDIALADDFSKKEFLAAALALDEESNPTAANSALKTFLEANPQTLPTQQNHQLRTEFAIQSDPEGAKRIYIKTIRLLDEALAQAYSHATRTKLGVITDLTRKMQLNTNAMLRAAKNTYTQAFLRIEAELTAGDAETLIEFSRSKANLFYLLQGGFDSIANRWSTASDRADQFFKFASDYCTTGKFGLQLTTEREKIFAFLNQEGRTESFRARVNRETISTGLLTALLVAEGVCTVATGGLCAATIPSTLGAMARVAQVANGVATAGRAYMVFNSTINLVDTFQLKGAKGLLSVSSAIDALMIVTLLPAPTKSLLKWAPVSVLGKTINVIPKSFAAAQYQAGYLLGFSMIPYGSWQIIRAESISKDLSGRGRAVSAAEVRKQGFLNLLGGFLAIRSSYSKYDAKAASSPEIAKVIEVAGAKANWIDTKNYLSNYLFKRPIMKAVDAIRDFKAAPLANTGKIFAATATLGYVSLMYSEGILMSQTYPDFMLKRVEGELPELKPGEIAVSLNGFDPNDILYLAEKSRTSREDLLTKYRENETYFDYDFATEIDFMDKLEEAAKHGRIRYLRIAAHGLPGRFASRAYSIEGESGFVDESFFIKHRSRLRNFSRAHFAPEATVYLKSCLVGARLDKPMDVHGMHIPVDAGDRFARGLGQTLLVNGGRLISSKRMLVLLEGAYGSAWRATVLSGIQDPMTRSVAEKKLADLSTELEQLQKEWTQGAELTKTAESRPRSSTAQPVTNPTAPFSSSDAAVMIYERLKGIIGNMYTVFKKYGLNIEGGFFDNRSRIDTFAPSLDP